MFKLGRWIHSNAVLNWRDIFDNLTRYAQAINSIDRDSLRKDSVRRAHLNGDVILAFNSRVTTYDEKIAYIPRTAHEMPNDYVVGVPGYETPFDTHAVFNRYKILREPLVLPDNEFGSYGVQWRISFDTDYGGGVSGMRENNYFPQFYAEVSVDGIKLGGPLGADDFVPTGYWQRWNTGPVTPAGHQPNFTKYLILSGMSFTNLVPGEHTVSIDLFTLQNIHIRNLDAVIFRMNW